MCVGGRGCGGGGVSPECVLSSQYTEGECNPLAGDNASVKYACNATSVTVLEYEAYGCVGPATTTVYPTGQCVEAVRAFNTIYTCNRTGI